jgi:hypothetical protein
MTAITLKDWNNWLHYDEPSIVYAKGPCGFIANVRNSAGIDLAAKRIAVLANDVWAAHRAGLVELVQRKVGQEYEYIAIRRKRVRK